MTHSSCHTYQNNYCSDAAVFEGFIVKHTLDYAEKLFNLLNEKITNGPQTFGFEYEFMPLAPLNLDIMQQIYQFLPKTGFNRDNSSFVHESGMYIDFEPGGQIEFHSPPLLKEDNEKFNNCITRIKETVDAIKLNLGIEYIAQGYIPGRKDSPLCLDAERYINLHNRLAGSSTRGLEMMKGTASIHFHAGIRKIEDLPKIYNRLIQMSAMDDFKMGDDRRDIWNNTDPSRCGQPFTINNNDTSLEVIKKITDQALKAEHISENKPFMETDDLSFDAFMYHLTTIFTDIRINIKGPSIELRTIDSVPIDQFSQKWNEFISILEL